MWSEYIRKKDEHRSLYKAYYKAMMKLYWNGLVTRNSHREKYITYTLTDAGKRVVDLVRPIKERGQPIRWDQIAKRLEK